MKKSLSILSILTCIFIACQKDSSINLQLDNEVGVDRVDSFSINTSTLSLDSLPTNGQNVMLIGQYKDGLTGTTTSNFYTQFDLTTASIPKDKTTFDSLRLVLYYNRYSYGDTLNTSTINVHQLTNDIELKDIPQYLDLDEQPIFVTSAALYNTNKFNYQANTLGSVTFTPQPNKKDSVIIKLSNTMGQEWFDLIKAEDDRFTNSTKFLDYFKGLVLTSGTTNTSLIGFKGDSSAIKLNYTYYNTDGLRKSAEVKFMPNTTLQFNQISADRSTTPLSGVKNRKTEVSSTLSNGQSLIQSGTGLVTKIKIPGLGYFLEQNKYAINNAELRIPVAINSNKTLTLPSRLVIMYGTKNNTPFYLLPNFSDSQTQYAYLTKETGDIDKYYYAFNITNQLDKINTIQSVGESLLLSYPTDVLFKTAEQVTINNQPNSTNKIKLIITYTKF